MIGRAACCLAVFCVFGVAAAGPIPDCGTAATLQDLIDFGTSGCTLPGDVEVSSWLFDAQFLTSGSVISASSIAVTIDPVDPPTSVSPNLFNILFTASIFIPPDETLVLDLSYSLGVAHVATPGFYYFGMAVPPNPGGIVGTAVSDFSALCVGGYFSGNECPGTLYERSSSYPFPLGGAVTAAVNSIDYMDVSSSRFTVTVPGSGGIGDFGVVAGAGIVPEPQTGALMILGLGIMLARKIKLFFVPR